MRRRGCALSDAVGRSSACPLARPPFGQPPVDSPSVHGRPRARTHAWHADCPLARPLCATRCPPMHAAVLPTLRQATSPTAVREASSCPSDTARHGCESARSAPSPAVRTPVRAQGRSSARGLGSSPNSRRRETRGASWPPGPRCWRPRRGRHSVRQASCTRAPSDSDADADADRLPRPPSEPSAVVYALVAITNNGRDTWLASTPENQGQNAWNERCNWYEQST